MTVDAAVPGSFGTASRLRRRWLDRRWFERAALLAVVVAALLRLAGEFTLEIVMTAMTAGIAALALTVLIGWVGQPSVMTGGLMIVGGYLAGWLSTNGWSFPLVCAAVLGAGYLGGAFVGTLCRRLSGLYPVLATLAVFSLIVLLGKIFQIRDRKIVGYPVGEASMFGLAIDTPSRWIVVAAAVFFLCGEVFVAIRRSALGRAWILVLERRDAAAVGGVEVGRAVTTAYALTSAVQFLAGAFAAYQIGFISYDSTSISHSLGFIVMVVLGSVGSIPGALFGAIVVVALPPLLQRALSDLGLSAAWAAKLPVIQGLIVALLGILVVIRVDRRLRRAVRSRLRRSGAPSAVAAGPSDDALVSLRSVRISYEQITAVSNASFDVAAGECLALVGPNGAGKTSLLCSIAGFPSQSGGSVVGGTVTYRGPRGNLDLSGARPASIARARMGIAYVPADDKVFKSLSVRDNLAEAIHSAHRGSAERAAELQRALRLFPALEQLLDSNAGVLSGGERQQLALAVAMVSRARLLLVDEASLGLAPAVQREIVAALRRLMDENAGTALIVAEPNIDVAFSLATTVAVVDHGVVVEVGPPTDDLRRRVEALLVGADGYADAQSGVAT